MRVAVFCEESQAVTKAFRARGHEAFSFDLQDCSGGHPEWHVKGNALDHLDEGWDLAICHPPCTYLSYVGMRHWNKPGRAEKRKEAMQFFMALVNAPIDRIAIENPLGYPSQVYRAPDQIIQPYYFGDPFQKRTCLWLKHLPPLWYWKRDDLFGRQTAVEKPPPLYICQGEKSKGKAINWVEGISGLSKMDRQKARSKTFQGIADAMAEQWGSL